jgi:hypothetical protein
MPIKELQFSFRISVEALAQALAHSNSEMNIQVLGTEPEQLNGSEVKRLPPPPKSHIRNLALAFIKRKGRPVTTGELADHFVEFGLSKQSAHNVMYNMRIAGWVRRDAKGGHRITKVGLQHG